MCPNPASVRRRVGDEDPTADRCRLPSALASDHAGDPTVSIDGRHQVLDVHDGRLELDDQERPAARMPGEDVDDATFAVDGERDLGAVHPSREPSEHPGDCLVQRGVAGTEQAVELASAPPGNHVNPDVERRSHPSQCLHGHLVEMSTLDQRDHPSRDPGRSGHILLAPAATDTNGPKRRANPLIFHPSIMAKGAYLPRIRRFRAAGRGA